MMSLFVPGGRFSAEVRGEFDLSPRCITTRPHPEKLLDFDNTVNVSLGLPSSAPRWITARFRHCRGKQSDAENMLAAMRLGRRSAEREERCVETLLRVWASWLRGIALHANVI
jgi:hypothetical protein